MAKMSNQLSQSFEAVRKRVGKLDRRVLISFEEKSKLQTVSAIFFIFISTKFITDFSASSAPLAILFSISVAELHAIIEETAAFIESFDNKLSLSFDSFNTEVKPSISSAGVTLGVKRDREGVVAYEIDRSDASSLEIRLEGVAAYL